jgi:hypothetical protein
MDFVCVTHTVFLSPHIQGPIATYGKKPLGQMIIHPGAFLRAEPQKGVLNHIAGSLNVARKMGSIAGKRAFVSSQC